jgi:hypothetical protein
MQRFCFIGMLIFSQHVECHMPQTRWIFRRIVTVNLARIELFA